MKKIVALALAFVLALPASFTMAADRDTTEDTIQQVEALCREQGVASAVYTDENGDEIPLDVTYTVSVASPAPSAGTFTAATASADDPTTYMIIATASAKIADGILNHNKDGVDITISLIMYWTDVFGTKNVLDTLQGGYELRAGYVFGSQLQWGSNASACSSPVGGRMMDVGKTSFFHNSIGWTSDGTLGGLYAVYRVNITSIQQISISVAN